MEQKEHTTSKEYFEKFYDKPSRYIHGEPSKIRQRFNRGMTAFLVVAASVLFYFALLRFTNISGFLWKAISVLKPILYGMVIAYLLNPIVVRVDEFAVPRLEKKMKNKVKARRLSRTGGILVSLIILFVVVTTLCNMLLPELYKSIRDLVITLPGQLLHMVDQVGQLELDESATSTILKTTLREGTDMFLNWMRTDLLQKVNDLMSSLTAGLFTILTEVFNALIGVIVSVYILFSKELFARQCKKGAYALMSAHHANLFLYIMHKSDEIFGGFVIGKIIDSAIIGVLCFLGLSVLDMPYIMLVSVIVGVTNVIPFFGPYIGAIPSAILIILVNPMKGIYFIIFVFLLQQLDGNFIGPKILGNSTGLSAFWVIFSILLGGGLFGFPGMLMGVPTFAVIYYIIQMFLDVKLEKKSLPLDSESYDPYSFVDDRGRYVNNREEGDAKDGEENSEIS